ncbi:MAG: YggU family protein [Planctomycetes bacterium]|nr:YggU family protein [Planctomycetota bacterium]
MGDFLLNQTEQGVEIRVKVVPGSSRTRIAGTLGEMLKIKVAAPPEKGKANQSLIAFLAKLLSVKKNDIEIISGKTNPVKVLRISGTDPDVVKSLLIGETA